jgi:hypothetical protein
MILHLAKKHLRTPRKLFNAFITLFLNTDLTIPNKEDYVYFTAPFTFINYPFSWVTPMVIVAGLLFLLCFLLELKTYFSLPEILKGFIPC